MTAQRLFRPFFSGSLGEAELDLLQTFFIPSTPSRATNSVVWAKIKNYFQHPGVHPENTHSLLFYNQRVQQLWQEATRRKAVTQVGQSQAVSGWTSQKQHLTMEGKKQREVLAHLFPAVCSFSCIFLVCQNIIVLLPSTRVRVAGPIT